MISIYRKLNCPGIRIAHLRIKRDPCVGAEICRPQLIGSVRFGAASSVAVEAFASQRSDLC